VCALADIGGPSSRWSGRGRRKQRAGRSLRWHHDEDASLVMQVRLPAEGAALVLRALEAAPEDDATVRDVSAETSGPTDTPTDTPAQRRADALVRLAESWLAQGERALSGGERQQLIVHVDVATLVAGESGRSELESGPVLAAETVPRYPGCPHTRQVEGHHVEHWAHGGATRLLKSGAAVPVAPPSGARGGVPRCGCGRTVRRCSPTRGGGPSRRRRPRRGPASGSPSGSPRRIAGRARRSTRTRRRGSGGASGSTGAG